MDVVEKARTTGEATLVRAFGVFTGTLLVAGIVIGSGVFKKIVPLAQSGLSESWILGAWVLAGFITMCGAFNLAGLSSLTEESGGVYEYLRLSFGNFASFLFGWTDFAIIGSASVAALGFIFSQTINALIPLPNPLQSLAHLSIGHFIYPFADSGIKILAIGTIFILTWVNYRGVEASGKLSSVFTAAKILGLLLLILVGLFVATPAHQATSLPSAPAAIAGNASLLSAFFGALLSVFWAYDGWVDLSFVTGEIKNPTRNLPRAIIAGVSIAIVLYVLVNYAYMRVLTLPQLAAVHPNDIGAAVVAESVLGKWGKTAVTLLIMVSVFGTLNAVLLSHSRIYFRMAQERFFFPKAAAVHPRYRTPHVALVYTLVWSCLLVISGTFDLLTDLVIFATFLFYGLLAVAVLKMKRQGKITANVIGYPFIQLILLLFALALVVNTLVTQPRQSLIGLLLILTGLPFYFYFKRQAAAAPAGASTEG
ncbi:APC family permease [Hymenobacter sp. BT770]|uniref:APC family permease n=1 Tax=Hymenobacter sp. BT770 TaxID=2886942 RepID=UPI001D12147D|nr:amino acid permease [Hymenobacter sp. BT770]MCC3151954.1 amino acid permease [Hymenobacter sp. BT770]